MAASAYKYKYPYIEAKNSMAASEPAVTKAAFARIDMSNTLVLATATQIRAENIPDVRNNSSDAIIVPNRTGSQQNV
jgi:hypothetical protein